jgi:hypothetical protein
MCSRSGRRSSLTCLVRCYGSSCFAWRSEWRGLYLHLPVVRRGINCDRPYQTGITVVTEDGRFVTELVTDEQGRFEVFLKLGNYVLIPDGAGEPTFPHVETLAVHVEQKSFTPVTIIYDSGIR